MNQSKVGPVNTHAAIRTSAESMLVSESKDLGARQWNCAAYSLILWLEPAAVALFAFPSRKSRQAVPNWPRCSDNLRA